MGATELYYVNPEFTETVHGELGCITCHGGENVSIKDVAHADMVGHPSAVDSGALCALCHEEIGETFKTSIHHTIQGMRVGIEDFEHLGATTEEGNPLQLAFDGNCYKCHSDCGTCHVSRPKAYTGGLHSEHSFAKTPPTEDTCYGCHGARTAGEYMGLVGYATDLHYEAGMDCIDCHDVNNFHGSGEEEIRKRDADLPSCTDCHGNVYEETDIEAHNVHSEDLMNCQVCHGSANNNCYDCHTELQEDGSIAGIAGESRIMFKIGLNPERTEELPYKYMTLRHVPTASDTFKELGLDELVNYSDYPNWKYSPIHNVQRLTIQNENCESCHGNEYIFLSESDLRDSDSEANRKLVVINIP